MRLTDPDRVLPERLVIDEFVLRPVTVDDAEADHAAVMDARTQLRLWSQSDWPADDLTVEENRADLLAMQHRSRSTATRRLEASTIAVPPRSRAASTLRGRGGCPYVFREAATVCEGGSGRGRRGPRPVPGTFSSR
ncbi:hypothetical protein [Tessaracoccus flavescens]|nr:hypothetical protein [Tessaracoccus flavescens]